MGLRDDKKRETRLAIVETAMDMFRQHGFDRTRIADIVGRLRISEATFFNYFPTKDAVLETAAAELLERSMANLRHDVAGGDDRPVPERLAASVGAFAESFDGDRQLAGLVADHSRFFVQGRTENLETALDLLGALLAEGQRRGEIRADAAPRRLAELWLAAILAMVHGWASSDEDDSLVTRTRLAVDVMLSGFRPVDAPAPAGSAASTAS